MHLAAENRHMEIMKLPRDIMDSKDAVRRTPLSYAAASGKEECREAPAR